MRLPRDLSGRKLVDILCRDWQYSVVHQTGSHIIVETEMPGHQRIAVPNHKILRIGTLNSILRCIAQHKSIMREEILN
jgi:predicted RNA binding protein YcfA (HicA-like mRNA interferase family)